MRIVTHEELPKELEEDVQLLRLSVGWPARDFRKQAEAKKLGYPSPDYGGLYAIEEDRVLSTVKVLRIPFTFPDNHQETMACIQSVITRRDCRGRGLARRLIDEVNAIERKAGSRFSLLWTEHSILAHRLYEHLGYRDIYTVDIALGRPAKSGATRAYAYKPIEDRESATVEQIHAASNRGRIGFTPRAPRALASVRRLGVNEGNPFQLVQKDGEVVGYVALDEAPSWVRVTEVGMSRELGGRSDLIKDLERLAGRRWISFWNTFVRDSREVMGKRGYVFGTGDRVLMSLPLDGSPPRNQVPELGADDPRFTCQLLDYF